MSRFDLLLEGWMRHDMMHEAHIVQKAVNVAVHRYAHMYDAQFQPANSSQESQVHCAPTSLTTNCLELHLALVQLHKTLLLLREQPGVHHLECALPMRKKPCLACTQVSAGVQGANLCGGAECTLDPSINVLLGLQQYIGIHAS